ncbi:disease resistance protein RPV1 isoform X1 [Quercus suber]|uniref:disease resistance protein RPV1 isoform X1 n=1 Tax=Quercus suber TaxID=58331 RepID=UPI0032DE33E1
MALIGTENTSSSFPSSSMLGWTYDVFLSFRGDTRKNFTDNLYTALKQKGIFTYRDDEKLKRGTFIAPELLKAIEESRFAIVILSKDYASSSWCLMELAKIVECIKKTGLIVVPVFHYVDPSDVRHQRETFADAFVKYEEHFKDDMRDVYTWRDALTQVASIAGWDLRDKHESRVIEELVGKIFSDLNFIYSSVHKDLVGIKPRVDNMMNSYLQLGLNDVRYIGIWGMGGMGKTTLARVIYDRINCKFEGSCFIANIRGKSGDSLLVPLQKQILSDILIESNIYIRNIQWGINVIKRRLCCKKVLIILDDVDHYEQLEALVGEQDWFGQGSRIIITTRNQHLLIQHKVSEAEIYEAKKLNNDEALQLFSMKAFKKDSPLEGYVELSQEMISYASGLPLALKVLGSFLFHRSIDGWKGAINRLKESPEREILDVLQISYDGLKEREKNIFLDIACFFNRNCEDYVVNILQTLYDQPIIDIDVLKEKSLITTSWGKKLQMHDLLQELGREIVRRESPENPSQRSRLWLGEDIFRVLKYSEGTTFLKGIFLDSTPEKVQHLNVKSFSNMNNLRLLKISNVDLPQGLHDFSSELCFIHWDGYPLKSMPTSFKPDKLVELNMPCSLIKHLWKGIKSAKRLKLIDLRDSRNLIETPDFSGVPNLQHLILQCCTRLSKIHTSLGGLKQLLQLDLSGCKSLESLPSKISLESLEVFILSGCSRLKKFPEIVGNMSRLSHLYLDGTAIKELPSSVEHLTGLVKLDLSGSAIREWSFPTFPSRNLEILSLSGCEGLSSKSSNKLLSFPLMRRASPNPIGMLASIFAGASIKY